MTTVIPSTVSPELDPAVSSVLPERDPHAPATTTPTPPTTDKPAPRLRRAERFEVVSRCESLDQRLPHPHQARDIWDFVDSLDLSPLYDNIKAVEGHVGRDATDPKILFAVWLYAFAHKQSSARAVAKLCGPHGDCAYQWLCGGVSLNYHLLADFRVAHGELLDQLFTDSLAALLREGLVDLSCTAQDGMRVRASAGQSSFRRRPTLEESLQEAQDHITRMNQELADDPGAPTRREQAARKRAAEERVQRLQAALENVAALAAQKEARLKGTGEQARVSTTDPEARTMKMPNGGYNPAYNVQFATAVESGVIVGVDVTNQGTDAGLMTPMLDQIEERTGQRPGALLSDGGFASNEDIENAQKGGTKVYTPVKCAEKKIKAGQDPFAPHPKDSAEVKEWRGRMGTEAGKSKYKLRAQTAELTNAQARNRGFTSVNVRGLEKVRTIALWYALVHNLLTGLRLRAERALAAASGAVVVPSEG